MACVAPVFAKVKSKPEQILAGPVIMPAAGVPVQLERGAPGVQVNVVPLAGNITSLIVDASALVTPAVTPAQPAVLATTLLKSVLLVPLNPISKSEDAVTPVVVNAP